jgi:hypothetical protein
MATWRHGSAAGGEANFCLETVPPHASAGCVRGWGERGVNVCLKTCVCRGGWGPERAREAGGGRGGGWLSAWRHASAEEGRSHVCFKPYLGPCLDRVPVVNTPPPAASAWQQLFVETCMRSKGALMISCLAGRQRGPANAFPEGVCFHSAVLALTAYTYCVMLCRALCMLLTAAT